MDDAEYFISKGFRIQHAPGEPGDLRITKDGVTYRVESKISETTLIEKIKDDPKYLDKLAQTAKKYGEKPAVRIKKGINGPQLLQQLKARGIKIFEGGKTT